jgi:prepilin-type N-terminal cleavage/methylation domain-containing protein
MNQIRSTNCAFTLIEILIVVTILGILAAIVFPQYQSHAQQAKESAAKENLSIYRSTIGRYAIEHGDVAPGYMDGNTQLNPLNTFFILQLLMKTNRQGQLQTNPSAPGYNCGPYFRELPENPFNNKDTIMIVLDNQDFPAEATGTYGWLCKPATKEIRIDRPGTDSEGVRYYDY